MCFSKIRLAFACTSSAHKPSALRFLLQPNEDLFCNKAERCLFQENDIEILATSTTGTHTIGLAYEPTYI
jgi:hypothetical protein